MSWSRRKEGARKKGSKKQQVEGRKGERVLYMSSRSGACPAGLWWPGPPGPRPCTNYPTSSGPLRAHPGPHRNQLEAQAFCRTSKRFLTSGLTGSWKGRLRLFAAQGQHQLLTLLQKPEPGRRVSPLWPHLQ